MKNTCVLLITSGLWLGAIVSVAMAAADDWSSLERQFRELPIESRRLIGPLFWLHGDESRNGWSCTSAKWPRAATAASRPRVAPHSDWLGDGWYRDLAICLKAAKQHNLKMWIFDEKWWPSQAVGGKVPPRYAAKRLKAATVDVEGPEAWEAEGYAGPRYIAAVAGRVTAQGQDRRPKPCRLGAARLPTAGSRGTCRPASGRS